MEFSDEEIVKKLAKRMKDTRKERGLTQRDVADRCNIEESAYRRIENAGTSPTLKTILAVSRALDVSMLDLFDFLKREETGNSK
jgi:transcriptional regulator with XRE-family HTH domain